MKNGLTKDKEGLEESLMCGHVRGEFPEYGTESLRKQGQNILSAPVCLSLLLDCELFGDMSCMGCVFFPFIVCRCPSLTLQGSSLHASCHVYC